MPSTARLLISCKIVKPRMRSRYVTDETRLIESSRGFARSEDRRRNVHMAQLHCRWMHTRALFCTRRVLRVRLGFRDLSVVLFCGRCIMPAAVLGHRHWQAGVRTVDFRSSNRFLGGLAAMRRLGICSLRELLFRQKNTIVAAEDRGNERRAPARRSTRNTWRRNRRSIPVTTAANSRRFCSPLFAPVARDRYYGILLSTRCLGVCKNSLDRIYRWIRYNACFVTLSILGKILTKILFSNKTINITI